jgi:hypothetical protein
MTGTGAMAEAARSHRGGFARGSLALAIGLIALLPVLASPTTRAEAAWGAAPVSWTNGEVLCVFAPSSPSVAVSALARNASGMQVTLVGASELRPDGSPAATAVMPDAWTVANGSTDAAYELAFSARLPVQASGNAAATGAAEVTLAFQLPAYTGSGTGPTNEVTILGSVTNWTWVSPQDRISLHFVLAPVAGASEHMAEPSTAGWLMSSESNASGTPLEQLAIDPTANATAAGGASVAAPVVSVVSLASMTSATVGLTFGGAAQGARQISFEGHVAVTLPATVAGIPITDLVAAVAAGGLASLGLAAVVRRLRRAPSDLIYAEEGT